MTKFKVKLPTSTELYTKERELKDEIIFTLSALLVGKKKRIVFEDSFEEQILRLL